MARQKVKKRRQLDSPWPNRMAWVLALTTLVSISTGGLVTSFQSWAAVPESAGSGRVDLFSFYGPDSWLGVWDVFLEHSHRLTGAAAGMIAIGLVVVLWQKDPRRGLPWLAAAAAVALGLEATVGGARVLTDRVLLAQIHAALSPPLCALCGTLVTLTSRPWRKRSRGERKSRPGLLPWLAVAGTLAVYLQVVLGVLLRHVPLEAAPHWAVLWTWLHVCGAALLAALVAGLLILAHRRTGEAVRIRRRAWLFGWLFVVQLLLGAGAWVTSYGWPNWFKDYVWALEYTVVAEGGLQAAVTTALVVVGALNLAAAVSLVMWSSRLRS